LRILDERRFETVWTSDGWQTMQTTPGRGLGSAGSSADIKPPGGCQELEWTLHWTESGSGPEAWLGYNVKVKVDAA
jgi:hypothetical protein